MIIYTRCMGGFLLLFTIRDRVNQVIRGWEWNRHIT